MDNNDEIIQTLIKRVYHLEQEVIKLGGQPYNMQATEENSVKTAESVSEAQTVNVAESVSEAQSVNVAENASEAQSVNVAENASERKTVSQRTLNEESSRKEGIKKSAPNKQNMENKIGKNVMGIMASILIFFSLVLFAGIAFNYLSDIAKVIIMFAVSIAIALLGIIKMPKKNEESNSKFKTFFTTLAACGIGAIYITDLVAYFGFKCIALIPFIISLVLWILVTMYLAYKCSNIFVYICNIGLIIATFLTAVQFSNALLGFVIYTICLIALYLMNRHEDFNKDSFYFIQYPLIFIALSCAVDTDMISYIAFMALLLIVFLLANVLYNISIKQMILNIVTAVLNVAALIRICAGINNDVIKYVTIGLLIAIMALYFIKYYRANRILFYIVFYFAYIVSVGIILTTDMYIVIALTPFILFIFAGFILKDVVIRIGGYIALFVSFMIQLNFYESWPVVVIYLIISIIAALLVWRIHYTIADKFILTGICVICLINIALVFRINICVSFVLFALIAIFMNLKAYHINPYTGDREFISQILGYTACGIMILTGMSYMSITKLTPEVYQVIIVSLITLILCLINIKSLYKSGIPEMPVGFYQCIKLSAWVYIVLKRLEAASFVISIVGILIAITCIVLGFTVKQKAFRLYGLIVSMISVVKLIIFDISYDSNILRPIGFFIAGILCFAISFIYSKLEKGISEDEKSENKVKIEE